MDRRRCDPLRGTRPLLGDQPEAALKRYPFLVPHPVPLSTRLRELEEIERSRHFTNFGPVNRRFESLIVERLFGGEGACCTVSNATLGLMLAIRAVQRPGRYAILPSFTFAATAHAALWCGLTPLLCDVDRDTWMPDVAHIDALLRAHDDVAVVIPYATFGNNLDVAQYERLARKHRVRMVIDAAASLGSMTGGSRFPVVFSMHATKTFATSEGGVVYARDAKLIATIRRMSNFGFDDARAVGTIGLNAKLPEVIALQALAKLEEIDGLVDHRASLAGEYRRRLRGFSFQETRGSRQAYQFFPARMTGASKRRRDALVRHAGDEGVELRTYFSPALHQQKFFAASGAALPVTEELSRDCVSFPLYDSMRVHDVRYIARLVSDIAARL